MLKVEYGKPVVYKNSDTMGLLVMKEIPLELAKDMCITYHYAHKWNQAFGKVNVGIFKGDNLNKCLGVASFGLLMHPKAYINISDNIKEDEILELNRLWIDDCLGKNAETILLSASWKILRYYGKVKLVQSFADGRLGCGTIYKASNFGYYGYSTSLFYENTSSGVIAFNKLLTDTTRPTTMVNCIMEMCKGNLRGFNVYSYRYLYKLNKDVNIIIKQEPYPEYQKGVSYIDEVDMYQGKVNEIFRGYILSHIVDCDANASYYIANHIKTTYNENYIKEMIDKQLNNREIQSEYTETYGYLQFKKCKNYMDIINSDLECKQDEVSEVGLW